MAPLRPPLPLIVILTLLWLGTAPGAFLAWRPYEREMPIGLGGIYETVCSLV